MRLEGIHHITAITADARQNVDFYAGTLGLRLVKKTVNQDDPSVYHLYYGDDAGNPGSILTFFEYRGARGGRAGAGMVHRIVWRVASEEALGFWQQRLGSAGVRTERGLDHLRFADPEGLELEVRVGASNDEALRAEHPHIPAEFALAGFDGVRAYSADTNTSVSFLELGLGFARASESSWSATGEHRRSFYAYDEAPAQPGRSGAGTVHHVAWAAPMNEHASWRERVIKAGGSPTAIIDRFYFRSIYFREPSGVLFEIASIGPGFTVDEPLESLGQELSLPPDYEPLRESLERILTPLAASQERAFAR